MIREGEKEREKGLTEDGATSRTGFRMRRASCEIDRSFCAMCCNRREMYFALNKDAYENIIFYIEGAVLKNFIKT